MVVLNARIKPERDLHSMVDKCVMKRGPDLPFLCPAEVN
jgi:hypothetical protein